MADIRRQVFNHLIYLHPGFYEDNRSSEIQSRLTADTTLLQSVIGSSLSLFLRNLLMVIGGIVLLFITNPKLTSIVVVALPLVIAPILIFGRRVRSLSRLSQDRIADIGSYVSETLGQIKTVQAYNHQVAGRAALCRDRGGGVQHRPQTHFPACLADYPGDRAGAGRGRRDALGRRHGRDRRADFRR